jgi:S1-C subfamily serine protease
VNGLDLVILGAAALAAYTGYRRGAVLQVASYVGLAVGVVAGAALAPVVASAVESPAARAAIAVGVLLGCAAAGDALGWWIGRTVWRGRREGGAAAMDAVAGSVVSVVAVLLVVWFLGMNLANGPLPEVSRAVNGSAVIRVLDSALPRPPSLLAQIRQFLNRFGFPEVFAGLPPAPVGSVPPPTDAQVADAEGAGGPSTVQVVGEACGLVLEGSGFVAEPGYVVTNAHVVAGVDEPAVIEPSGPPLPAVPVLFDPGLDVAVLFVPNADVPALPVLSAEVDDGTGGAVIGYPGGVRRVDPAAVLRTIQAIGRDIYGRSLVTRTVYELQTHVAPGSSGGPFVVPAGSAAGVVFAASTTDPDVGYAITSEQVAPLVRASQGRADAVDTGACIR